MQCKDDGGSKAGRGKQKDMEGLIVKKRVELTVTEIQWIESALLDQMKTITTSMNSAAEGSQIRQILQLRFDNLETLANKMHGKIS
jgi:hypothetical protein